MFALASEQSVPTGSVRQTWAVVSGLCAGAFTAVGLLAIAPHGPITVLSLLIRTVAYTVAVFLVSGATTLLSSRGGPLSLRIHFPIALRTASAALWLAPLAAIAHQESLFALVPWVVFWIEVVRLVAFLRNTSDNYATTHSEFVAPIFALPNPNLKSAVLSMAGAFLCQAAVVAAIGSHTIIAASLGILSTIALVCRGVWMIEASPPTTHHYSARQILNLLSVTTWLIVFSWLPYILPHGEIRSLAALWRFFTPDDSNYTKVSATQPLDPRGKMGGGSPVVPGAVFPGVILYPELKPRTILVAPPPQLIAGSGTEHSDPLSIPFNGVYWLWRPPGDRPPASAVLHYGSPAALSFRSTDGSSLWMEAHQNLVKAISLDCCKAIQVVLDNADAQADGVAVELMLRNTTVAGKPYVSLGMQDVAERPSEKRDAPIPQTLTFHIPHEMKLGKFDELKVGFRLQWWRDDKSAKIAINRFVLVPGS